MLKTVEVITVSALKPELCKKEAIARYKNYSSQGLRMSLATCLPIQATVCHAMTNITCLPVLFIGQSTGLPE